MEKDEQPNSLESMLLAVKKAPKIYHPSLYWEKINAIHLECLLTSGYKNFKRSINPWYFGSFPSPFGPLVRGLVKYMLYNPLSLFKISRVHCKFDDDIDLQYLRRKSYLKEFLPLYLFIYEIIIFPLFYIYVKSRDRKNLLEKFEEPSEGNPFICTIRGRQFSQDLLYSVLDYYDIVDGLPLSDMKNLKIAELGAGYGRLAFVFLKHLRCKYVIFDIPPALYVCQNYLSSLFPELKIFKFRDFNSYSEIKSEYQEADLCFLTPNQLELLPAPQFNLFVTIDSLQEMRMEQIDNYLSLIDKYTSGGYSYIKQRAKWTNPDDNITISYKDYPFPKFWNLIFKRKHQIQSNYFEALYRVDLG